LASMAWRLLIITTEQSKSQPNKSRPKAANLACPVDRAVLADRRSLRTRDRDRLACLDDAGGLTVSHIAPGRDADPCHDEAGDQRHHQYLQMRRTIGCMN
jgi:hypothetical protein